MIGAWTASPRPELDRYLADEPHAAVLRDAGFAVVGEHDFPTPHEWTVATLTGFLYSTAALSHMALGSHAPAFEQDVADRLLAVVPEDVFGASIGFHTTIARVG